MSSFLTNPFSINGVIRTDKTALENLNELCTASSSWLTYDISTGKWCVIINKPGTSVASFNNSNIIGNIDINDTGINEMYNEVSVEFPHIDLRDETDYVDLSLDPSKLLPNEFPNRLNIKFECINNPVQAQYIGSVELKQSRVGKIISFRTDFSKLGVKAGDLIDITSDVYGYTNKIFRVIAVEEDDSEGIVIGITALEYDVDVYNTNGLTRIERTKSSGIILASQNPEIQRQEDVNAGAQLTRLLVANVAVGLLKRLFQRKLDENGEPTGEIGPTDAEAEDIDKVLGSARRPPLTNIQGPNQICVGQTMTITASHNCTSCLFEIPEFDYPYEIIGLLEDDIEEIKINGEATDTIELTGVIPLVSSGSISITVKSTALEDRFSEVVTVIIGNLAKNVTVFSIPDYTYQTTRSASQITEGQSVTFTVNTTGVGDNTQIPYTLTGNATGRVSTQLTGTLTINNGTGNIVVNTIDDSVFTGTQTLTFTINPGVPSNPCGLLILSASVEILDNDLPPPPDTTCQYVLVPAVWCAVYDGEDNQMKAATVRRNVYLPVPLAGEASIDVPVAISVTKGNPSTITITETIAVASSSTLGGMPVRIITNFNSVQPNGLITGSGTTVYGYLI